MLIVDDVPANLVALEAVLEGLHCEILAARSGEEALKLVLRHALAVVLLDVRMPVMDGYEVARLIRMHSASRDLPIIFLTAEASRSGEHELLGYDSGAVDFLFKPIDRQVLRSKVRVFLELHANRRALWDANARLEELNAKLLSLVETEAEAARRLRKANEELREVERHRNSALRALEATQTHLLDVAVLTALARIPSHTASVKQCMASALVMVDHRIAPQSQLAVVLRPPDTLRCHPVLLKQLLFNVISGALDAVRDRGNVSIDAGEVEGGFVISVFTKACRDAHAASESRPEAQTSHRTEDDVRLKAIDSILARYGGTLERTRLPQGETRIAVHFPWNHFAHP
ncbi:MAG TPA: response regulator [Polyangiaceae bacterium]|nr:response regulator [Polyangiaceae bacterium]